MSDEQALRNELASQLAEKCARHHLVVFDDAARHYDGVVETVIPDGWRLERYDGSWWALRRRLEEAFSAPEPPRLVVYLPALPLPADPLEEVRQAGGSYKRLLPTLLKDALSGTISETRLAELGERCCDLLAAEAALGGHDDLDPRIISASGSHNAEGALSFLLVGGALERQDEPLGAALVELAKTYVAAPDLPIDDVDAARSALARHLVLGEVARALGDQAAQDLVSMWQPLTPTHARRLAGLVDRLGLPNTLAAWGELADEASAALRLSDLGWDKRLIACDIARCIDEMAFAGAVALLVDDPAGARDLVTNRTTTSRWLRWRDQWSGRTLPDFDAIDCIARLRLALDEHPVPHLTTLERTYSWYSHGAWRVVRAQRLMEGSRYGLARPGLDEAFTAARAAYLVWLDDVLDVANRAAAESGEHGLVRQADIYETYVAAGEDVALVIVDGMRLELGHRLSELMGNVAVARRVDVAVGAVPTITRMGMANLVPNAATEGLGLRLVDGHLSVEIGDRPIRTVADRSAEYRAAAGQVEDHALGEWSSLGDDVLRERVGAADLVVVRAQEIDAAGEAGLAAVRWSQIDAAIDTLTILITRLAAAGISKVVVTADHGFIALGRPLDASRALPVPTGMGVNAHGRAWIGTPGIVPEGCVVVALGDFAVRSSECMVASNGMTVFGSSGAGYFHGGVSPQEALVPVVVLELKQPDSVPRDHVGVRVAVPGGRISAEAFSIRVGVADSLFASGVTVRVTAVGAGGGPVARLMPGAAVDARTGTIQLDPAEEAILTFLVTENLDKGSSVDISVLDATTGRRLGSSARATIARDLRPQEEW